MDNEPVLQSLALRRELAMRSANRLKLQVSAGALIAIVSASQVLGGIVEGTLSSKVLPLFGLALGVFVMAHYSMLLIAKRSLRP